MSTDDARIDWDAYEQELSTDETPAVPVDDPDQAGPPPGPGTRRPVLPRWLHSPQAARDQMRWAIDYSSHVAAYHLVRVPFYGGKLALRAPRGLGRVVTGGVRWMFDWEAEQLRRAMVRDENSAEYMKLANKRDQRVRLRVWVGAFTMLATCGGAAALTAAPLGWQAAALATAVAGLGLVGGNPDAPLLGTAVVSQRISKLTGDAIERALLALGIAGINRAVAKDPHAIGWPARIGREGAGWRADIDLPPGVTATEVIAKREALASALSRPLGCVWPEGQPKVHPGRLVVWVGDQQMSESKNPEWPLLRAGTVNLFKAFPLGTDPRGRAVEITLMFASMLIGSIPRMGKTFTLRLCLLAAALDPRAQVWPFDLKGTGDFRCLEPVAHRYRAGDDHDDIEYGLTAMRELHAEMRRRTKVLRELPPHLVPESKVTDELASQKSYGLFPIAVGVDECQRWFEHPEYGEELREICEDIVRRGPALGIMLLFGTQRPDKDSIPAKISANVVLRYALKVVHHTPNDMILGSGMHTSGISATMFARSDKGIGWLVGEGDEPQITRTHEVDNPKAEAVVARARAAREAAGTLSGHALGVVDDAPVRPAHDVLADVLTVIGPDERNAASVAVAARLAELRPEVYAGWDTGNVSAALKPYGVVTGQVWATDPDTGKKKNLFGIKRDDILSAIAERDRKRGK
ncbi:FtsK/SpoIIIE domain-containing protein [Catellatospora citrea]|uniref:Cell division protein FtsK n=1 Tax=Catellatospora citrea TaxID=53366 RepID=A0A8J3P497_9ACTN|nr:FtsK/SpoIIIE domain-containing protein [Catellatospora citrea]RKE08372.1 S-DNA-T family DNA segregation ATPase FtsK/SpoIIIE [Catellatospora citrea]GIG03152.1 cell division protein FtsK [Catellatospora citrea]